MSRRNLQKFHSKIGPYGVIVEDEKGRRPVLNADGQRLLTEWLAENPNPIALITSIRYYKPFMRYAVKVAGREDVATACIEGAARAMCTWQPELGAFSTYSIPYMKQAVQRHTDVWDFERKTAFGVRIVSDSRPSKSDGNDYNLSDYHLADTCGDTLTDIDRQSLREEVFTALRKRVSSWRYREIFCLRRGLYGGEEMTLEDVADTFEVTRERVRQIEAKVAAKLRADIQLLRAKYLQER